MCKENQDLNFQSFDCDQPPVSPVERLRSTEACLYNTLQSIAQLSQQVGCVEDYVRSAMALQAAFALLWLRQSMSKSKYTKYKALNDPTVLSILEGEATTISFTSLVHAAQVVKEPIAIEFQPFQAEAGVYPLRVTPKQELEVRELLIDGLSCLESRFKSDGFMITTCYWPPANLADSPMFDRQVFRIAAILGHRCVLVLGNSGMVST